MNFSDFDDSHALRLLSKGDQAAFTYLYKKYSKAIYRRGCFFLRSSPLAKEVVQEVFLKLWLRRAEFSSVKKLDHYLNQMTVNLILDKSRAHLREWKFKQEFATESKRTERFSNEKDIEAYEKIISTAQDLPPQCRKIFIMAKVNGLSHKDIADQLKLSIETVKKQSKIATKILREKLAPYRNSAFFPIFLGLYISWLSFVHSC